MQASDAPGPDRLVLSPAAVFWRSTGVFVGTAVALVPLVMAAIGVLVTASSVGKAVLAGVLLAFFVGLDGYAWVATGKRYATEKAHLPTVEATPDELRLTRHDGRVEAIPRAHLVSVVRLRATGMATNRLQFRDEKSRQIGVWDIGWLVGSIMRWLAGLGYQTSQLTGRAAVDAAYRMTVRKS